MAGVPALGQKHAIATHDDRGSEWLQLLGRLASGLRGRLRLCTLDSGLLHVRPHRLPDAAGRDEQLLGLGQHGPPHLGVLPMVHQRRHAVNDPAGEVDRVPPEAGWTRSPSCRSTATVNPTCSRASRTLRGQAYATQYEQMYAQPVKNEPGSLAAGATADQPSRRSLIWARIREFGEAITQGGDPARIVEQARELVDVLQRLEVCDHGPGWMRPIPMVSLNDHQVALIYSLVLMALVGKTGSTADRPGEPQYSDVRDR